MLVRKDFCYRSFVFVNILKSTIHDNEKDIIFVKHKGWRQRRVAVEGGGEGVGTLT